MSIMTEFYKSYQKSPNWVQNTVGSVYNLIPSKYKYGVKFVNQLNYLKNTQYLSKEEMLQLQNKKFLELVRYSYNYVPYYKGLFDEHGISLNSIKTIDDIKIIPFLTKEIVRDNFESMISTKVNKNRLKYVTTGGTSGKPFGFYIDYDNDLIEWAFVTDLWSRIGFGNHDTRLVMRGKTFSNLKKGIPWQYDSIKKELSISIFDMTEENMYLYVTLINKYKPEFIHGYISAVQILCKFIEKSKSHINYQIKGVLGVSENIHKHQVEYIEKILNARVFSFYGHSERLILAGECEYSTNYHVTPQYGITEIVDKHGNIIEDNSLGELIGTGFNNLCMPFIRYKTGDMARWSKETTCKCGRSYKRLETVEGRWKQEMLMKKDESLVSITALNMHSNVFDNVKQFQLYQSEKGKVIVKVVCDMNFKSSDKESIINELIKKTGDGIDYSIEKVKEIKAKTNGKYIFVEQKLNID